MLLGAGSQGRLLRTERQTASGGNQSGRFAVWEGADQPCARVHAMYGRDTGEVITRGTTRSGVVGWSGETYGVREARTHQFPMYILLLCLRVCRV